jgi:hypothetical protein
MSAEALLALLYKGDFIFLAAPRSALGTRAFKGSFSAPAKARSTLTNAKTINKLKRATYRFMYSSFLIKKPADTGGQ